MKKNIFLLILIIIISTLFFLKHKNYDKENSNKKIINYSKLEGIIIECNKDFFTLQNNNNIIYTFDYNNNLKVGNNIVVNYSGKLDSNNEKQKINIRNIKIKKDSNINFDKGIFKNYYSKAYEYVKSMSLDEKISQLLLVRYPDENQVEILKKYQFGGYLFFEKDLKNKTRDQVKEMIANLQNNSKIPILTAVDEEGGAVVRISSNSNLVKEKFKSPRDLYLEGGLELIKKDTIEKSKILSDLGFNLNLAPVVDVSTNENDYIYKRTLGENTNKTALYAKTVIKASKNSNVSYTLKHFPGYGNNINTHTSSSIDSRKYDDIINNSLPPFISGVKAGAEAVLINHNIINSIDKDNPASLSKSIHNLLRNKVKFTGVIITDDLYMKAVSNIENLYIKAILAGNDILITTDYENTFNQIKKAVNENTISNSLINNKVIKVIAWKKYKGLKF